MNQPNNFNKRREDIQLGRLIEKVNNIDDSLKEFKDHITREVKTMCNDMAKKWDSINHYFGMMHMKVDIEKCDEQHIPLAKTVQTNSIYLKVILSFIVGIPSLIGIIYGILKIFEHLSGKL